MTRRAATGLEEAFVDIDRLDRIARWIGASNRRQVLGGALAGVTAVLSGAAVSDTVAKKREVGAEGPCGNGSVKANRCRRNRQCCTGLCDKKKGKKPYGRCRCRKLNQTCKEDRNCCATAGQPMSCVAGTCQAATTCVVEGGDCSQGGSCCDGLTCLDGTCTLPVLCVPLGRACSTDGLACCTNVGADATCAEDFCNDQEYCATTLETAGCEFTDGPDVWNCGSVDLSGLNLSGCVLSGASFFAADLTNAELAGTILTSANFFDANVTGVVWDNTTCPTGVNSDDNDGTCCNEFTGGQVPTGCAAG